MLGKLEQPRVWPGSRTPLAEQKPVFRASQPSTWTAVWAEAVREVSVCEKDTELLMASFLSASR